MILIRLHTGETPLSQPEAVGSDHEGQSAIMVHPAPVRGCADHPQCPDTRSKLQSFEEQIML